MWEHRIWVIPEELLCEVLHDAVDLLALPRQLEVLQVAAHGLVDVQILQVEQGGEAREGLPYGKYKNKM